jgi:acetate kinase
MSLLVLNAGSSSLKFTLFDAQARAAIFSGEVDWGGPAGGTELVVRPHDGPEQRTRIETSDHNAVASEAIRALVRSGDPIAAVGHRVVHGGTLFRDAVRIDPDVKDGIARLVEQAPLHNPPALEAIAAAEAALPGIPQVAVFDTAFYASLPAYRVVYPLPYAWYAEWGVRRFGFHGISHAYCAGRAAEFLGRDPAGLRLVVCHLGNGCSATAIDGGVAVDTTMGFTPNDGLMMGTRSGSIDPGIPPYLIRHHGLTSDQLDDLLNHGSGLLGVSGVSSDFRGVTEAAARGNERARLALDIYAARVRSAIGALTATLGGLDALVFTAGVGENAAALRAQACGGLSCLGLRLDLGRNAAARPDADIAEDGSPARILILRTQEDLMIARETRRVTSL